MSQNDFLGHAQAQDMHGGAGEMSFIINQMTAKMQTVTLVRVVKAQGVGVNPVGSVDVQPLVAQLDGSGNAMPHGVIYNVPYFRLQGGKNAVIIDPEIGDIGLCAFASRDISQVKQNRAAAAPPSRRRFDFADGLYLGGFLNGTPEQYVLLNTSGMKLVSPKQIELEAPNITIKGETQINGALSQTGGGAATFSGSLKTTGNLETEADMVASGKSFLNHTNNGMRLD